jgi:hypothetical protein
MANRSEFRRVAPQSRRFPGGNRQAAIAFAALALVVAACTESTPTASKTPLTPKPLSDASIPFNDEGRCLAADAYWSGAVGGVNDSLKLADPTKSCTANDIRIATIDLKRFKIGNGDFQNYTGQPITCTPGQALQLDIDSHVKETATSQRTDVGIWIGLEGSNARTGTCNHYNLVNPPAGTPVLNGVNNDDGDQCGDITLARESIVPLGIIDAICQTSPGAADSLHIGSCLGWTQPGGDQVCPQTSNPVFGAVTGANGFRFGTVPGTSSKCNCEGFNVPIIVNQKAFLEVKKVCDPTTDTGTFDLLIDGSNQFADNVACGTGTTGKQELGAGTSANPGAVHTFGEGDFTTANYTSSFVCANRSGGSHAPASGTSLGPNNITLQPNEDVVCTYTNVRIPEVKLVKDLVPDGDDGKFDLTIAGTTFNNGGAGFGDQGTTGFQKVSIGTVAISEAAHTGTSLGDYTTTLACDNGKVPNPNNNTSGSITVAAGDQITCTFTNTRKPRLRVLKATVPTTDPGKFDFTIAGTSFNNGGAGFGNGEGTAFQTLSIGNVNISEAAHTGTTLSDYTSTLACDAGKTPSNNTGTSGTVNLAAGDVVTCTFTNTKGAVLKVVKATVPTTDLGKFDFTIAGTGFNNGGAGFGNGENTGFQPVPIGSVSVSEAGHTGTLLTDYTSTLACTDAASNPRTVNPNNNTSGTLTTVAGDQITCTFTNTRKPEVKLVKDLVPDADAGRFDLTIAGTTFDNGGAGFGDLGNTGFQKVSIGSVNINEAAHTGTLLTDYTTTLSCDNGKVPNPNNNTSGTITVAAGDKITCTFVNTRKPEVKLVKDLVPDADPGRFDLTIAGTTFDNGGAGFGDLGNTGFQKVSIGSVNISEAAHTGTTLSEYSSSLACDNGKVPNPNNNTSGTITVAAGDRITCTFTNTKQAVVKLVKDLVPDADAGRFDLTIAGTTFNNGGAGFGDLGNTGFQVVSAGSVNISEAAHTGTSLSNYGSTLACNSGKVPSPNNGTSGTISVAAGDIVTCTFTNTRKAQITVAKTCTGGGGVTFGYSLTGPSGALPGFNRDCGASAVAVGPTLDFGSYTINETTIPVSWAFDSLVCSKGTVNGSTATIALAAGDNVTCTYTNKLVGRAQIAPTATTCEAFAAGTSSTLAELLATVNNGSIQTVSPGVFFYYAEVNKGAGQSVAFAQTVNPNPAGLPLYDVQQGQAFLSTVSGGVCTRVATLTLSGGVWSGGSGLAAGSYILGVKFTPEAAKGLSVPGFGPGALLATHNYSLVIGGVPAGGQASVNTKVKP